MRVLPATIQETAMTHDPPDSYYEHDYADDYLDNSPYCECDLEPYEEEEASNTCSSCGKLLS